MLSPYHRQFLSIENVDQMFVDGTNVNAVQFCHDLLAHCS